MPLPWLDQPIMLEGSRMSMCDQSAEDCAWKAESFRNWYVADYVYAQGTVFFFAVAIGICMLAFAATSVAPASLTRTTLWRKAQAILRFLAYRSGVVGSYRTSSLGVGLLITCGALFFLAMTLGPQPYYWPDISWGGSPPIATRAGWMSLACLPFMLALSTKANMIAVITGVSHEKLIIFHKWTGWAMFVLALVHTFPFIVVNFQNGIMEDQWTGSIFYWSGVVALIAQAYLQVFSLSFIRNRFYEFFKATHLLMAVIFVLFLFFHCDFTLTSAYYFIAAGVLYFLSFAYGLVRTYFEHGIFLTANIDLITPGTLRITTPVRRNTTWTPGQHMFLRFPGGAGRFTHGLSSHPFTICSVPTLNTTLLTKDDKPDGIPATDAVTFYAAVRGGLTAHLAKIATGAGNDNAFSIPVRIEGPYGGIRGRPLESYDSTLIIACGAGAAFSLGFVMDSLLLNAESNELSSQTTDEKIPRLEVIIATREAGTISWYTAALSRFIQDNGLPETIGSAIRIKFYETGPGIDLESSSSSSPSLSSTLGSLQIEAAKGRPAIHNHVRMAAGRHPRGSLAILACGPGSVLHDVQAVAAEAQVDALLGKGDKAADVYLHTEHFSW